MSLLCTAASQAAEGSQQPNILFFLIDDLGFADCGFNGGKEIQTPNIDKLAKTGTIIDAHHARRFAHGPLRHAHRCVHDCETP